MEGRLTEAGSARQAPLSPTVQDAPAWRTPRPPFTIRSPGPADAPELARLFSEMQRHYGEPVPDGASLAAAMTACSAPAGEAFAPRTFVAADAAGAIWASIVLNVTFPASRLSRSLYVRDLYVAAAARRQGLARALLRAAARLTLAEGYSALDWTTDAGNAPARTMYEGAGAQPIGRVYYRMTGERLQRAAAGP